MEQRQCCHRSTAEAKLVTEGLDQSFSHFQDLWINTWKSCISDIVGLRHFSLVGFVERISMEHDKAEGEDIGVI